MGKLLKRIKNNIKKKNPMVGWKTGKETEAVVLKPDEKGPEFVVGNPSPEPRTDVTREDMRYLLDKEAEREAKEKVEIEDKPVEGEAFATGLSDHSIPNGDVEDAMKELADKCTIETEIVSPMENFKKLRTTSVMVTNAWHKADGSKINILQESGVFDNNFASLSDDFCIWGVSINDKSDETFPSKVKSNLCIKPVQGKFDAEIEFENIPGNDGSNTKVRIEGDIDLWTTDVTLKTNVLNNENVTVEAICFSGSINIPY